MPEIIDGVYTLGEQIGMGGFAKVFLATVDLDAFDYSTLYAFTQVKGPTHADRKRRAEVLAETFTNVGMDVETIRALLESEHVPVPGEIVALKAADAKAKVERFEGEWKNLLCLNHDNVIKVYGGGRHKGRPYYAMELLENIVAPARIKSEFTIQQKLELLIQGGRGLAYLHDNGIIHRDVKPDNMVTYELDTGAYVTKVTDLGIAKDVGDDDGLTKTADVMGTMYYMPPEQFESIKDVDQTADVYALGASLYEFATEKRPYQGKTSYQIMSAIIMKEPPEPPKELVPELPKKVALIVEKAMSWKPKDRYRSISEMCDEMQSYLNDADETITRALTFSTRHLRRLRQDWNEQMTEPRPVKPRPLPRKLAKAMPVKKEPEPKRKPRSNQDKARLKEKSPKRKPGKLKYALALVALLAIVGVVGVVGVLLGVFQAEPPPPVLAGLKLSGAQRSAVGDAVTYALTGRYEDGSGGSIDETFTLSANPAEGATISGNSVTLTGKVVGPVQVTASFSGKSAAATLRNAQEYIAIDVSGGPTATKYPVKYLDKEPTDLRKEPKWKTTTILLRRIPKGTFTMGSPEKEWKGLYDDNRKETQHKVTLTKDFYMGVFETTQKQWELVMGKNPSEFKGTTLPVETGSWNDVRGGKWPGGDPGADTFMGRLRERVGVRLDLPTAAQWEYACRAGTTTAYSFGDDPADLHKYGNYREISSGLPVGKGWWEKTDLSHDDGHKTTAAVGSFLGNGWGLYDVHGNVREWCLDYHADDLGPASVSDPLGSVSGSARVLRGGSWIDDASGCRSGYRDRLPPGNRNDNVGFRVCLASPVQ